MAKAKHSARFDLVKRYYETIKPNGERMWDESRVRKAVEYGWITEAEASEILGE